MQCLAPVKTKVQEMTGVSGDRINTQSGSSALFSTLLTCFCLPHFSVPTAFMCKQENLDWLLLTGGKKIPLQRPFLPEPYLGLLQCLSWYFTPPPQVREHSDHFDQADHWPWTGRGPSSPSFTHWPCRHHCRKNMRHGSHQRPPGKFRERQIAAQ